MSPLICLHSDTWYMKSIKGNKIEMGEHKWILKWRKSNENKGKIRLIWVQDEKLDYAVRISKTLILKYCSFRISWFVKDSRQTSKEQSLRTSWTENELAWIPQNQKSKCQNWWCLAYYCDFLEICCECMVVYCMCVWYIITFK